jgi:coatomer subunit gamma
VEDTGVKKSVNVLLNRCLDDVDDEVRDRAALYLKTLEVPVLAETYVKEGEDSVHLRRWIAANAQSSESIFSLQALEAKLVSYVNEAGATDEPFDVSAIPKISRVQAAKEAARAYLLLSQRL